MNSHESQESAGCKIALLAAVHTLAELKLGGNHLKGSRPVLSFHAVSRIPATSPFFGQSTVGHFAFHGHPREGLSLSHIPWIMGSMS